MDVHEFATLAKARWQNVDIAHISPPCQFFSPNHTQARGTPNDEKNFAASFCVKELLGKIRPRFVTSEQTFGILHAQFSQSFNVFLSQFTDFGYSITWRVVRFHQYGLPQRRRRLLLMAAAPGETLPDWPAYTHSDDPSQSLKPFTTVNKILRDVRRHALYHDEQVAKATAYAETRIRKGRRMYPVWDASKPYSYTICTAGAVNEKTKEQLGYPDGRRNLTSSELAALQGVPPTYILPYLLPPNMTNVRKIVGNMFPPTIAQILLTTVRKHLEVTDEERRRNLRGV